MEKILVVDDSEFMIDVIIEALELIELNADKASNGKEGLDLFTSGKYRLVITDINMPEMDGITFIQEIRKIDEDTPILVLTTESEDDIKKKAIQLGADSWLVKPFEAARFIELVKELTE